MAITTTGSMDLLLRQARRALHDQGRLPQGLLPHGMGVVSRSWQRSMAAGVDAFASRPEPRTLSHYEVALLTQRQHELLAHARPVMEYVYGQTRDSDSMVVLADAGGLLLHALGDLCFLNRAERVALAPGASWNEHHRGTNAIGTALAEAAPVVVHGDEHYLECNSFLTCAAAPVIAPDGAVLGVLDISGERGSRHPHTFAMVRSATQMIENRLFEARHGRQVRLHFHPLAEGIGTLAEGVLALSDAGVLVGANQAALALLGLAAAQLGQVSLKQLLGLELEQLVRMAHRQNTPLPVRTAGTLFHVRVNDARPRAAVAGAPTPGPQPGAAAAGAPDALAALDTGDATWRAVLDKARKMLDQPVALLLYGESGAGKEVLAKAWHHSSRRRQQPFVAVNCAALPESLIEAELFGYAPGAYTGARREGAPGSIRRAHQGTLFLDEIGDMPLALQTRLLRVLQERQVMPLGGAAPVDVDFALICATHCNLKAAVEAGRFRADLYWRLNGLTLQLPPLRQRSDRDALVQGMVQRHASGRTVRLQADVAAALGQYGWPGNLRQLDSVLRTALALLGQDGEIGWEHLPDDLLHDLQQALPAPAGVQEHMPSPQGQWLPADVPTTDAMATPAAAATLAQHNRVLMVQALAEAQGNVSLAARRLGISRNTFYRHVGRHRPA